MYELIQYIPLNRYYILLPQLLPGITVSQPSMFILPVYRPVQYFPNCPTRVNATALGCVSVKFAWSQVQWCPIYIIKRAYCL
jgi:hypothetical protein